jgi:hypothetical protein
LEASRDFATKQEIEKGIQYILSLDEPHYFILVSGAEEKMEGTTSKILERFNGTYYRELNLKVSNLTLNGSYVVTLVADFPQRTTALDYYRAFDERLSSHEELKNHKFNTFIITKENFDTFYRTKGLNEYIRFFEKNYLTKNP